nr:hypothetical protein CFP56_26031 [Quercus suber]
MRHSCSRSSAVAFVSRGLQEIVRITSKDKRTLIGITVYLFIGCIILDKHWYKWIPGGLVALVGIGYIVLEYIPSIEPPANMRDADSGWGAEQTPGFRTSKIDLIFHSGTVCRISGGGERRTAVPLVINMPHSVAATAYKSDATESPSIPQAEGQRQPSKQELEAAQHLLDHSQGVASPSSTKSVQTYAPGPGNIEPQSELSARSDLGDSLQQFNRDNTDSPPSQHASEQCRAQIPDIVPAGQVCRYTTNDS